MNKILFLILFGYIFAYSHMLGVHPPLGVFDLFKKDNQYQMIVLVNNAHTKQHLPTQLSIKQELKNTLFISKNKKDIKWEIKKSIKQKEHTKIFISLKSKISSLDNLTLKILFLHTKMKQVKNLARIFLKDKTREFVLNKKITKISL